MTADHTSERLSAAEREALMDALSAPSHKREWFVIDAAQDILAAHLADVEARLAAVEALADEWDSMFPHAGRWHRHAAASIRRALHPDSNEKPAREELVGNEYAEPAHIPDRVQRDDRSPRVARPDRGGPR